MSLAAEIAKEFSPDLLPAIIEQLSPEEQAELEQLLEADRQDEIDKRCSEDTLYWLRNHTLTENEQWKKEGLPFKHPFPFKPFPGAERDYFDILFGYFKTDERLFTPKTRDMMTSWSAVGWGTHQAQWHKATVVVQTESEEKAKKLVKYAHILWDNQSDDLKRRHPLKVDSTLHLEWKDGGEFFGIPCGETKIRIHHPTIYIMDEAAFLPGAQQLYDAAHPVAGQIIAISSAGPGWFGNQCAQ
jgi:hypothetical protein